MRLDKVLLVLAAVSAPVIAVAAQQQPVTPVGTPGVQAGRDPNRAAFVAANCKNQPAAAAAALQRRPPAATRVVVAPTRPR